MKTLQRSSLPIILVICLSVLSACSDGGGGQTTSINITSVPDTGQTTVYTTTFGSDGDYLINPPSYTDIGDGTIRDNVTNLIWQKQGQGLFTSWDDANTYCSDLSLAGLTWRLPTVFELFAIADYSDSYSANINTDYFPDTQLAFYWSATVPSYNPNLAWELLYNGGLSSKNDKSYGGFTRCVHGPLNRSIFVDGANGTVTDLGRRLVWQKNDDGSLRDWEGALAYCEGLSLGGQLDWRLPNVKELNSLVDFNRENPAIDASIFTNTQQAYYWTSTTSGIYATQYAYLVAFGGGTTSRTYSKASLHYVRCVRGGT